MRKLQQRNRRFEMVPIPGRHKFEIRDLNEYSEDGKVTPLSLPKLPTDRKEIVTNGLIRSTNSYNTDSEVDMSISGDSRPTSYISTASDIESYEEEKLKLDTSSSEKSSKVNFEVLKLRNFYNFLLFLGCNFEAKEIIQNALINVEHKTCIPRHKRVDGLKY